MPGLADDPVPAPTTRVAMENLTQTLIGLNERYRQAAPALQTQLIDEFRTLAAERRQSLLAAIQDHPGEVLRVALPAGLRGEMPGSVQQCLEQRTAVEGELEVLAVDHSDPKQSEYRYFLNHPSGSHYSLHFAGPVPELLTGTKIRAHGLLFKGPHATDLGETDSAMALEDGASGIEILAGGATSVTATATTSATALPNTFGPQKTLVILVNLSDKPTQPYTPAFADNVVFTTTSNFDKQNSFDQTSLTGNVAGWYTIPLISTICDYTTLASQARDAATKAGIVLANYTRYVYGFPQNACGWWGLGTLGGNPSQAWINGSFELGVVGHELGHNFGLYHAHSLDCGSTTLGSSCTTGEYGDTVDIMGGSLSAHFNTFQKERLGWLNYGTSPPIATVQVNGDYWLDPYATAAGINPKALKILKGTDPATGQKTWYYVEYRQAEGFDSFLSTNTNVLNGVLIRTGSESGGNSSYLLDLTPATTSWNDPALVVNQSFNDPEAGVTITPTWMNGGSAIVNVAFSGSGCVRASPTLTLSPTQSQWAAAGTAMIFNVTVANKDSSACSPADINLKATLPGDWTGSFGQAMLSLAPGATASTALTVTSPTTAASGSYSISVAATNTVATQYSAASSVTVSIVTALNVALVTDKASYTRNQPVMATTQVKANGAPVANAAVTFNLTKSNGSVVKVNATSDANGTAKATFQTSKKDPTGVYEVSSEASLNSLSGSANVSITVK